MNIFSSEREKKKTTVRIRLKSSLRPSQVLCLPLRTPLLGGYFPDLWPYASHQHRHTREITHTSFGSTCPFLLRWCYAAHIASHLPVNNQSWKSILVVTYISSPQTRMKTLPFLPLTDLFVVSNILLTHFLQTFLHAIP